MFDSIKETDVYFVTEHLNRRDWPAILNSLQKFPITIAGDEARCDEKVKVLQLVVDILSKAADSLKDCAISLVLDCITECFRILRNSCIHPNVQTELLHQTSLLSFTRDLLSCVIKFPQTDKNVVCVRVGIQLIGNLVVNHQENQILVWQECSSLLMSFLESEDEKIINYSSMVIHNILLGSPQIEVNDWKRISTLLIYASLKNSDFANYALELLLKKDGFLEFVYEFIERDQKSFLLDVIFRLIFSSDERICSLPIKSLNFLVLQFKHKAFCILRTCEKYVEDLEPTEVSKLLDIISSASGKSPYMEELQKDKSLLIDCVFLLKSMHSLGKMNENNFSSIQKLSVLADVSAQGDIQSHPAFGFKCNLVRVIGNLCWKSSINQDEVRELDGIALLLDCCNIDARNPLLIQWVILALRNLCEGNLANQEVIASMNKVGVVETSVLREIGITLHEDEHGGIGIMRLPQEK